MKKLLLILLLLFPVHGAWAEVLILECKDVKTENKNILHFDFSSEQVFNNAGKVIGIGLREVGNMIYYHNPPDAVPFMRKKLPTFQKAETTIDRTNKQMTDRLFYSDRDIEVIYSNCEKFNVERKF